MEWSGIPWAPPARTLRQFAGLWLLFCTGLACSRLVRHGPTAGAAACALLAVTVGPLGLWRPAAVRPVYVGLMVLTFPLGWVVSRLVLACLWYGVFTPLGLALRLAGRDPLRLRASPDRTTYWEPRPGA